MRPVPIFLRFFIKVAEFAMKDYVGRVIPTLGSDCFPLQNTMSELFLSMDMLDRALLRRESPAPGKDWEIRC